MVGVTGMQARIVGVGLWSPGYRQASALLDGPHEEDLALPKKVKVLDRACSRRASAFSKAMALAFENATQEAGLDLTEVAAVFGSALGETHIMIKLLEQMRVGDEDFSPMAFAVSVHNAASGLVSISTKNRAFTTSVAADYDTPAMALMEAIGASLDQGVPAVLVCGDEASPEGLVPEEQMFETLAASVVVDANATAEGRPGLADITEFRVDATRDRPASNIPPRLVRNPQAGLLELVDAIVHGRFGRVPLDRGEGSGWSVEVSEVA